MNLDDYQLKFLTELIGINSVGADPLPGMPYGKGPHDALEYFLSKASEEGMRTEIIGDRVGYC